MKETTRSGGSDPMFSVFVSAELESTKEINKRVEKIAKETGHSMAQIAYAWSLAQPFVAAPIVGSYSVTHCPVSLLSVQQALRSFLTSKKPLKPLKLSSRMISLNTLMSPTRLNLIEASVKRACECMWA